MRIAIGMRGWRTVRVTLNEREVQHCIMADNTDGVVECLIDPALYDGPMGCARALAMYYGVPLDAVNISVQLDADPVATIYGRVEFFNDA